MTKRTLSLFGAVFAGALVALPATAAGPNSPTDDPSDRGVITPHSTQDQTVFESRIPGGTPVMPEMRDPLNPNRVVPFVQQPEGVGDLLAAYGPLSYISIRPASAESGSTDDSEGISPVVWIVIIVGVVLVVVVAMVVRRRVGDEDRA